MCLFVQQEAKIEPEDFTSRLYQELSSSPQPYLVPFLKVRSVTRQTHMQLQTVSTVGLVTEHSQHFNLVNYILFLRLV